MFYQGEGIKSGMHHPDGLLWIRTPELKHSIQEEKVTLCSIAPTVLKILGVRRPETLRGECLV
jgi:bisphosphoglycerate-independent phosphoglycerate mutase (AlkP superfamily)